MGFLSTIIDTLDIKSNTYDNLYTYDEKLAFPLTEQAFMEAFRDYDFVFRLEDGKASVNIYDQFFTALITSGCLDMLKTTNTMLERNDILAFRQDAVKITILYIESCLASPDLAHQFLSKSNLKAKYLA